MSDLIIIPVNDGLGSFKGLIDLKNTLNYICQKEQRKIGKILITLNNIKSDNNTQQINNWIYENKFTKLLAKSIIKHSKSFINTENDLSNIWTNSYYRRQKQAYEELIAEIL